MPSSISIRILTAAALLSTSACILEQKLGETAEDSGGSTGSGETTTGSTSSDPSVSTDPSTTSGFPDPSTSDGGSTGGDSTVGTGEPPLDCVEAEDWVAWSQAEPLPGIPATFAAVLEGPCTIQGEFMGGSPAGPHAWELYLECSLSGRVDGDATLVDVAFSPTIAGTSTQPPQDWLPLLDIGALRLRVVLDWWGMGWSRYLVLHRDDEVVLDLVDAEYADPRDGSWVEDIDARLGAEPWHDTLGATIVEAECPGPETKCGASPRALDLHWAATEQGIVLHGGQAGSFPSTTGLTYQASVVSAQDISEAVCTDQPLGDYRFAIWTD